MKTPVLKRRLNPFLLATTVLVLSLLAGLSVMYQGQLSDILSDKKSLEDTLEDRNQKVSNLQAENANLSQQIQEKNNRINSLASESSQLESEVSALESDVNTLEVQISEKDQEILELENEKDNITRTLALINESFENVCEDDYVNMTEDSQDECDDWGHEQ